MFKSLYRVRKKVQQSTEFTAYFYSLEEAEQYAIRLAHHAREEMLFTRHNSVDGSIKLWWQGDTIDIVLDDNSWLKDAHNGHICLMPLNVEFMDENHVNNFIKRSQRI